MIELLKPTSQYQYQNLSNNFCKHFAFWNRTVEVKASPFNDCNCTLYLYEFGINAPIVGPT